MNRRDIFRAALIAPAAASVLAAKGQFSPLTAVQQLPVPDKPKIYYGPIDWQRMADEAVERLQVRLMGLDTFCADNSPVAIGCTYVLAGNTFLDSIRYNKLRTVTLDSLYSARTENLDGQAIVRHGHWNTFVKVVCPMVDDIADKILRAAYAVDGPVRFATGKLELPMYLPDDREQAVRGDIPDKLSIRLVRFIETKECRRAGADCEIMYDVRYDRMVPVEKPFHYHTRLDVLGGFLRRRQT